MNPQVRRALAVATASLVAFGCAVARADESAPAGPQNAAMASYCDDRAGQCLAPPLECRVTFCESWETFEDGSLVCFDVDERYPAGHWTFTSDAEQDDLVMIEY